METMLATYRFSAVGDLMRPRLGGWMALLFMASTSALISQTAEAATYHAVDLYPLHVPPGLNYDLEMVEMRASPQAIVGASTLTSNGEFHALLWNHANGDGVDLHPLALGDVVQSEATSTAGTQHVGTGLNANDKLIGLLWNGGSESAVKLQPYLLKYIAESECLSTDGVHQVGLGYTTAGVRHALLWSGTAASAIDLHPANLGIRESKAIGTYGGQQIGVGSIADGTDHALLWNGTASSAIDLNPVLLPDIVASVGFGIHGAQQVGVGQRAGEGVENAMLWTGSAASAVNLHPDQLGMASSWAWASNGSVQVGSGMTNSELQHALMWQGTPESAIDLHLILPPDFYSSSADFIDAQGNVFGWAASDDGFVHAIRWSPDMTASPADFNEDGVVNDVDMGLWRGGFGVQFGADHNQGDADADGDADGADFLAWQQQFSGVNGGRESAGATPEPDSFVMGAVAMAIISTCRRVRFRHGD